MPDSCEEKRAGAPSALLWWCLLAFPVAFGAFAYLASRHMGGRSLMAALVFLECAAAALVSAVAFVDFEPRKLGVWGFLFRVAAACAAVVAGGFAVLVLAAVLWGAEPLAGGLLAQVVVISFCLLLGAVYALVRRAGAEPFLSQLVSIFVGCVLMGTVFYADPVVEAQSSPERRSLAIRAVLAANPMTAISWSLLRFDLMRRQIMYDRISVIGRFYRTEYPPWWKTAAGYVIASAVLLGAASLLGRGRAGRNLKGKTE